MNLTLSVSDFIESVYALNLIDFTFFYIVTYMFVTIIKIETGFEISISQFTWSKKVLFSLVVLYLISYVHPKIGTEMHEVTLWLITLLLVLVMIHLIRSITDNILKIYFLPKVKKVATERIKQISAPGKEFNINKTGISNRVDELSRINKESLNEILVYISASIILIIIGNQITLSATIASTALAVFFLIEILYSTKKQIVEQEHIDVRNLFDRK